MKDDSDDEQGAHDQPRKRAAIGDGISAGSGSPYRESSPSPPPRRSKARPTSGTYELPLDIDSRLQEWFDSQRPFIREIRQVWTPDDNAPLTRASFADPLNITSIQDTLPSPALGRPVLRDAIPASGLKEKTSSPRYRRGRGRRQEIGVNGSDNPQDPVIHPSNSFPSLLTMLI